MKTCAHCNHRDLHRVPGTDTCRKLVRVMFNTPLSCWEGRQPGLPCGPDALLFEADAQPKASAEPERIRLRARLARWLKGAA